MIDSISGSFAMAAALPTGGAIPSKTDNPQKIHEAAKQFESLLIGELLKTAHEAGGSGWLGTDDDDPGQTGVGFGEEQFSRMLAGAGGLGLAPMIESGLKTEASAKGQLNASD
jgi:Rod binding domain-containing protein